MQIWIGLGNPGAKYAGHRHNIGFMAIDAIADEHNFSSEVFMNESGQSVQLAMQFYKVSLDNIVVFHDELDLDFGKVRSKIGGGMAGHNGLKSIKKHCGNEYRRIRIGIDHPGHKDRVHGHVLSDFRKDETHMRDDILNGLARYADLLAGGQADLYQTRVSEYIKG